MDRHLKVMSVLAAQFSTDGGQSKQKYPRKDLIYFTKEAGKAESEVRVLVKTGTSLGDLQAT